MEKKILFVDLDGTLLDDNKDITPGNLEAIQKAADQGHKLEYAMAFASVVPPSIGYILSHIGEGELNASIENIANTLNIKSDPQIAAISGAPCPSA